MARMRTIDGAYAEIHEADPGSAVSKKFIRHLVITGAVPACMAGKKYLLNFDALERYLAGDGPEGNGEVKCGESPIVEEVVQ